jgi:hypothetical protein
MQRLLAVAVAASLAPLPAAAAPAPAQALAPAPAPAQALEPGMVRFHLEIDGRRRNTPALFRLLDYDREGVLVCEAPCGVPVSASDRYQVRDRNEHTLIASRPFALDPKTLEITASVRTARRRMYSAGLALAMIGPVLAVSGSLLLGLGAAEGGPDGDAETYAGIACLSAGVAMLVIGVPMLVTGRNRVRLRPGAPR